MQGLVDVARILIVTVVLLFVVVLATAASRMEKTLHARARTRAAIRLRAFVTQILLHLEDGMTPIPSRPLTRTERAVLKQFLMDAIDRVRGMERDRLVSVCGEVGFIAADLRHLRRASSSETRVRAAHDLGRMRAQEALPELFRLLHVTRRRSAGVIYARAIARCASSYEDVLRLAKELLASYPNNHALIADMIDETSLERGEILERLACEQDISLVEVGLIGLQRCPPIKAAQAVRNAFGTHGGAIRVRALHVELAAGSVQGTADFEAMVQDADWQVRAAVARLLGDVGDVAFVPSLCRAMTDENWFVRYTSAQSLGAMHLSGFAALCEIATRSQDRFARDMARSRVEELLVQAPDNGTERSFALRWRLARRFAAI